MVFSLRDFSRNFLKSSRFSGVASGISPPVTIVWLARRYSILERYRTICGRRMVHIGSMGHLIAATCVSYKTYTFLSNIKFPNGQPVAQSGKNLRPDVHSSSPVVPQFLSSLTKRNAFQKPPHVTLWKPATKNQKKEPFWTTEDNRIPDNEPTLRRIIRWKQKKMLFFHPIWLFDIALTCQYDFQSKELRIH